MPAASPRSPDQPPRPRARRRRLLFVAGMLLVIAVVIETAAFFAYRIGAREWFSYDGVYAMQLEAAGVDEEAEKEKAKAEMPAAVEADESEAQDAKDADEQEIYDSLQRMWRTPHPYLGYVYSTELNQPRYVRGHSRFDVTSFGFIDDQPPIHKRSDDQVIVGIVGGSVALGFSIEGDDALARILLQHPGLAGKKVRFVRLGLGGYKQPQQLLTVAYLLTLGAEFDMLVNIDGFNELAMALMDNVPVGVYPYFPRGWHFVIGARLTPDQQRLLAQKTYTEESRQALARTFLDLPTRYSVSLQCAWRLLDRRKRWTVRGLDEALRRENATGQRFVATGPGTEGFTDENIGPALVDVWVRGSTQLRKVCEQNDILYLHCLQPNQYLEGSKPMPPEELEVAVNHGTGYAKAVQQHYHRLIAAGDRIRAAGVDFHDLTMVFQDHPEPLYIDTCCHVNRRGNEILAQRIGAALLAALDRRDAKALAGKTVAKLDSPVRDLALTDPLQPTAWAVTATFANGERKQLALGSLGAHLSIADPGLVEVSGGGMLRGRHSGQTSLHVRIDEAVLDLPVTVRFPPVVTAGTGTPGKGGHTPTLALAGDPPRPGDRVIRLRVAQALGGAAGAVLVAGDTERRSGGGVLLPDDGPTIPLACGGEDGVAGAGFAIVEVPLPTADTRGGPTASIPGNTAPAVAWFQAVVQDPSAAYGCSASNALRVELAR